MKKIAVLLAALAASMSAFAQGQSLASAIDVYVFPTDSQEAPEQSKDEAECYEWAVANSGSDPFDLEKQAEAQDAQAQAEMAQAQQTGQGAGAGGALKGAAAGALIGEIADNDVGHSAAVGAAIGGIHSRRRGRAAQQQAVAQAEQSAESSQQATAEQIDNFKKAFSVCLEAKDYMVKY